MVVIFFLYFVFFCLSSCSQDIPDEFLESTIKLDKPSLEVSDIGRIVNLDPQKPKELKYYVDYPVFENSVLSDSIHSYFNNLIAEKERIIETESGDIQNPEIHASFAEYTGKGISSIVYNIYEYLGGANGYNYAKIFYVDNNGKELNGSDIFSLNENNKAEFREFLFGKIKGIDLVFDDNELIYEHLDKFLENLVFYIDSDKIVFYFNDGDIGASSYGIIKLEINIEDVADYLNKNIINISEKKEQDYNNVGVIDTPSDENDKKDYEGVNLDDYIIFEEIEYEEAKKLEKDKKYVALTFDDGPNKTSTPNLLEILKENDVKVTFFVLGKNANYFPDIIKQINDNGHEIGSHSWNHPDLTRLSSEDITEQIKSTDNLIYDIIGKTPKLVRPPYGEHNSDTDMIIDRTVLLWDVDSLDWKTKNVEKNIENVTRDTKEGSIILMHDIHKTSVDSIDTIIKSLKKEGFEFVTVSELLKHYQKEDYSHKSCYSGFNCR